METTQKETLITQNMLIAQFMGVKPRLIAPDCYGLNNMPFWSITGDTPDKVLKDASLLLNYHNDWNELIAVVKKIANMKGFYAIENDLKDTIINAKIEAVYNACIEFIKWYNKKK
jgi:hypothetical protein